MQFRDFLRLSVLLFGGAATALAVARGWWLAATITGLWLGRRLVATPGIARLIAGARAATHLPDVEPGTVMFNRLWPLALLAAAAGALGFFIPQVPAIATGYALLAALSWRNQAGAVEAIEGRDGVQFWLDRTSPFGAPKLLRLPGMRKIEPVPATEEEAAEAARPG